MDENKRLSVTVKYSESEKEYQFKYLPFFKKNDECLLNLYKEEDSILNVNHESTFLDLEKKIQNQKKVLKKERQERLREYIQYNRNSYVALWFVGTGAMAESTINNSLNTILF